MFLLPDVFFPFFSSFSSLLVFVCSLPLAAAAERAAIVACVLAGVEHGVGQDSGHMLAC